MLLPHFLSPTEALEPTSCLVMNLLCILSNFDIQVCASRSHSKGCFSCPKKKTLNAHISKSCLAPRTEIARTLQLCLHTLQSWAGEIFFDPRTSFPSANIPIIKLSKNDENWTTKMPKKKQMMKDYKWGGRKEVKKLSS